MVDFAPSPTPDLDNVPSAEGPLPPTSGLIGRPCARDWLIGLVESDHYVEDVWAG